ncbi:hypothetical protein, partial [Ideonella azotifigens]|uniref:hypothetical protein n=1 Tax=Ideonella azotifigens TaxID=513160 RepID=UPI001B85C9AE
NNSAVPEFPGAAFQQCRFRIQRRPSKSLVAASSAKILVSPTQPPPATSRTGVKENGASFATAAAPAPTQ